MLSLKGGSPGIRLASATSVSLTSNWVCLVALPLPLIAYDLLRRSHNVSARPGHTNNREPWLVPVWPLYKSVC